MILCWGFGTRFCKSYTNQGKGIVELVGNEEKERDSDPAVIQFKAVKNDEAYKEIIKYITILDQIQKGGGEASEWHVSCIDTNQVLLNTTDQAYKSSRCNVRETWENEEAIYELH